MELTTFTSRRGLRLKACPSLTTPLNQMGPMKGAYRYVMGVYVIYICGFEQNSKGQLIYTHKYFICCYTLLYNTHYYYYYGQQYAM